MEWFPYAAGTAGFLLGLIGFIRTLYRDSTKDQSDALAKLAAVDNRVSLLERMMDMIFKQVSINFAANLHKPHPDYIERDRLIEKFVREQITPDEMQRFRLMLEHDRDNGDCDFKDQALAKSILEMMDMQYALRVSSPVLEVKAPGLA